MAKIKVCIVSVSLGKGGLERSCANLSLLLSDYGYNVHLVILNDDVDYEYKGQLFNLGIHKTDEDTLWTRLARFTKLRRYFRQQKFDYIIDNRIGHQPWRELYYMLYIYGLRAKVVYVQHSSKLENHLPDKSFILKQIVRYAYAFIGVSKGISAKFNAYTSSSKCQTIYNYKNEILPIEEDYSYLDNYILFLGRLDDATKNITLLLESFSLISDDIASQLIIMGDGPDKALIEMRIADLKLQDRVVLKPFEPHVYLALSKARCVILTSRHEGFPMVLVEALSVGTPLIAVDCESGPSEIVQNEINGLLVENYNPEALAQSVYRMYTDQELYDNCKKMSKDSIAFLDKEVIVKQWLALLK